MPTRGRENENWRGDVPVGRMGWLTNLMALRLCTRSHGRFGIGVARELVRASRVAVRLMKDERFRAFGRQRDDGGANAR